MKFNRIKHVLFLCIIFIILYSFIIDFVYCRSSNYYEILGVPKTATKEEIKQAYRKLALKYHPDRAPNESKKNEYNQKYTEIAEAYETLSNKSKRRQYDASGYNKNFQQDHAGFNQNYGFKQRNGFDNNQENPNFGFNFQFNPFSGHNTFFESAFDFMNSFNGFGFENAHHEHSSQVDTKLPSISLEEFEDVIDIKSPLSHILHIVYIYRNERVFKKIKAHITVLNSVWNKLENEISIDIIRMSRLNLQRYESLPNGVRNKIPAIIAVFNGEIRSFEKSILTSESLLEFINSILNSYLKSTQSIIGYSDSKSIFRGISGTWKDFQMKSSMNSDYGAYNILKISTPSDLNSFLNFNSHSALKNETFSFFYPQLVTILISKNDVTEVSKFIAFKFRHFTRFSHITVDTPNHWILQREIHIGLSKERLSLSKLPTLIIYNTQNKKHYILHSATKNKIYTTMKRLVPSDYLPFVHLRDRSSLIDYCHTRDNNNERYFNCFVYTHPTLQEIENEVSLSKEKINQVKEEIENTRSKMKQFSRDKDVKFAIASNYKDLIQFFGLQTKGSFMIAFSSELDRVAIYDSKSISKNDWIRNCIWGQISGKPFNLFEFPHPSPYKESIQFGKYFRKIISVNQKYLPYIYTFIILYIIWKSISFCFSICFDY